MDKNGTTLNAFTPAYPIAWISFFCCGVNRKYAGITINGLFLIQNLIIFNFDMNIFISHQLFKYVYQYNKKMHRKLRFF